MLRGSDDDPTIPYPKPLHCGRGIVTGDMATAAALAGADVSKVVSVMEELFPLQLAEDWDNVGLLVGPLPLLEPPRQDGSSGDERPPTMLLTNDLTEAVLEEALREGAHMIITYHPLPFTPLPRLTSSDVTQRIVMRCVQKGIAVYSPHTACDNGAGGVNDWLAGVVTTVASATGGATVAAIKPIETDGAPQGAGRGRRCAPVMQTIGETVDVLKSSLGLGVVRFAPAHGIYGSHPRHSAEATAMALATTVRSVCVQAGSGVSVLKGAGGDLWVTGEMSHHDVMAANAAGTSVLLLEHSNSERGFLPKLADTLLARLPDWRVAVSVQDADPILAI